MARKRKKSPRKIAPSKSTKKGPRKSGIPKKQGKKKGPSPQSKGWVTRRANAEAIRLANEYFARILSRQKARETVNEPPAKKKKKARGTRGNQWRIILDRRGALSDPATQDAPASFDVLDGLLGLKKQYLWIRESMEKAISGLVGKVVDVETQGWYSHNVAHEKEPYTSTVTDRLTGPDQFARSLFISRLRYHVRRRSEAAFFTTFLRIREAVGPARPVPIIKKDKASKDAAKERARIADIKRDAARAAKKKKGGK